MFSPLSSSSIYLRAIHVFALTLLAILFSSCSVDYSDVRSNPYNTGRIIVKSANLPIERTMVKHPKTSFSTRSQPASSVLVRQPVANTLNTSNTDVSGLNSQLFVASGRGDIQAMRKAISQGANINAVNTNGETALHSAATHNQSDAVRMLLDNGADVNARTILNWSPLHSAARFGSTEVVTLLLQSGVDVNAQNSAGKTALNLAKQAGHIDVVRILRGR